MRFLFVVFTLTNLIVIGCQDDVGERQVQSAASPNPQQAQPVEIVDAKTPRVENHQDPKAHGLQPYESVKPRLVDAIHWVPGKKATLQIELVATDELDESRLLGYEAVGEKNPVAEINFLDGDLNYHSLKHVELAQRSGKGVYSAEFELPAGARGADVIVRVELGRDDVTVEPLEIKGIRIEFDLLFGGSRSED